jgi:type II secretion system protein H
MPSPHRPHTSRQGFTLVELILVLAVLAVVTAIAAPTLGRSLRDRHLKQEGLRLLALIELGRSEAISQGVPIIVWFDASEGTFGIEPKQGFDAEPAATRDFKLGDDVWFDALTGARGAASNETTIEFAPDGMPEEQAIETLKIADKFGGSLTIVRSDDGWGYEILKEATK